MTEAQSQSDDNIQSYQVRPDLKDKFKTNKVKEIIQNKLSLILQDKQYDPEAAKLWAKEIADTVNQAIIDLNMKKYKHVVQVMLGQHLGSGCNYMARCRWDCDCDSQTSDVFSNASLFCVCTVFGIYLY
ncbi:dynein light chain Tctex-type protein 2B-like [Condylostylus longicornis]|uniref:dynein light chain Tctex-type protein 2B-like n=1 Tax=Condylostylus longicornis TaxID=2530218 RepID=UPI00244D9F78|nr:dynein light chain Tctex-type protein 2B-like [Condylostylus longicornis]